MDNTSLESLWQQYDAKLDRIERLNKNIIYRMISRKTAFKVNFLKFQCVYRILLAPFIFSVVILPSFLRYSGNPVTIAGFAVVSFIMAYALWESVRYFRLVKTIKFTEDTILETKKKMVALRKDIVRNYQKMFFVMYPMVVGVLMIIHPDLHLSNTGQMAFVGVLLIGLPVFSRMKFKVYVRKFHGKIEKELDELKDFTEGVQ